MPRRARRPDPPPLETNDAPIVLVGTCLWAAGLVVLLVLRFADLAEVRDWWIGMCAYGIALGLIGLRYLRRRRTGVAREAATEQPTTGQPTTGQPTTGQPTPADPTGAHATRGGATRS